MFYGEFIIRLRVGSVERSAARACAILRGRENCRRDYGPFRSGALRRRYVGSTGVTTHVWGACPRQRLRRPLNMIVNTDDHALDGPPKQEQARAGRVRRSLVTRFRATNPLQGERGVSAIVPELHGMTGFFRDHEKRRERT